MANQTRSDIAVLYRRAGFSLNSTELDQLVLAGYSSAVEGLLSGLGGASDPGGNSVPLPNLVTPPPPSKGNLVEIKAYNRAVSAATTDMQRWWMDRMISTSTPLSEKLTLFWHGHFATSVAKVRNPTLMYMQNLLFRRAGGGSFATLMQEVAKDGAMMVWLDTITDKKANPNENFAREMMELFTLGVGNYSQQDVVSGARSFTGWNYNRLVYRYVFDPLQHDFGSKTYLGQTGNWNGENIVSIATARPESPRFILAKLWSHFAYPVATTDNVVTDLLGAYGAGMSISGALRAIFLHPAFLGATTRTGLVKQPVEYLAGAARALGLNASLTPTNSNASASGSAPINTQATTPTRFGVTLPRIAGALGQKLFDPPNVGGWGQNGYWLDTVTAQVRLEVGLLLARRGDISTVQSAPPSQRLDATANLLGLDGWGSTTAAALNQVTSRPVELVALALASPEYVLA